MHALCMTSLLMMKCGCSTWHKQNVDLETFFAYAKCLNYNLLLTFAQWNKAELLSNGV